MIETTWLVLAVPLIKQFEGLAKVRPDGMVEAYPDPATKADPWTIGYGQTGADVKRGTVWTKPQCEARLLDELNREYGPQVMRLTAGHGTPAQLAALVSFAFNVGLGNLKTSTLLRKHNEGDHAGAQAQFARWNKAAGKVMAGLTRRRAAEATLYGAKA